MRLVVLTIGGTSIEVEAEGSDTAQALKAKLERQEGIPVEQQHLLLEGQQLEDGARPFVTEWYQPQENDPLLAQVGRSDDGRPKPRGCRPQRLPRSVQFRVPTLSDYGIQDRTVLHLVLCKSMRVFVDVPGPSQKTLTFYMDPWDTVGNVQDKVLDETTIWTDDLGLAFEGRALDPCRTLSDYALEDSAVLQAVYRPPQRV
mmetsp:Transcript_118385/g.315078  ORF Transcript_118385/g.315078 Transcript_118385/m.315078 type:complete len:201 (-) Transcript_118385:255-857(-)